MYMSKLLLLVFMFIAVWFCLINISKLISKEDIPTLNFIIQAIGIVGVIAYFL